MADDQIARYYPTPRRMTFCPTCNETRDVWTGETVGGEVLLCCVYCQRVHLRQSIEKYRLALAETV